MKALNAPAIAQAYFRFVGHFLLLIASIVLVIYAFLATLTQQVQLLGVDKARYEEVLFTQRLMEQKVDSIYLNLKLLNTKLVRNNRPIEQRVLRQKDELNTLLTQKIFERRPNEVYRRVAGCVNEMLVLKDSIYTMQGQANDIQRELNDCQKHEKQRH
ncbi:MAG: hypothetical protein EOO59_01310 [Hymenobacter sp.]|nr:MAG: hypothetical protein EOO59_01310 [Hymenobacter sp.]